MATTIKQISVYNGSAWQTANIGVDASDVTLSSNIAGSTNLQTALNNILPASQLAASKIVLTDANKKLTTSTVSTTELGYLSGTTASIQTQLNGKVAKTGDTMSGDLTINKASPETFYKSTNVNSAVGQTVPSSGETQQGGLQFTDSQGYNTGWVRQYKNASDNTYIQNVIRRKVNSSDITNSLSLGIKSDGSRYVTVADDDIWRTAIGAPPTSHASTATTYGTGTADNYGHCKVYNGLGFSTHQTGVALSAYQGYVLNQKISGLMNSVQSSLSSSTKAVANNTIVNCGSVSLSAGLYIIVAIVSFSPNSNGFRQIAISRTSASLDAENRILHNISPAVSTSSVDTRVNVMGFVQPTSTTVYYLNVKHNAGSSLTISAAGWGIMAYKLH